MRDTLHAIRFREKGHDTYQTALILAKDEIEATDIFHTKIVPDDAYDIDMRTLSWAGTTIPWMGGRDHFVLDFDLNKIDC